MGADAASHSTAEGATGYDPHVIEPRWQADWERCRLHQAREDPARPKRYVLGMFPYPSGRLHMGHLRNYTLVDVVARYARMRGYNVLNPMGWDAFGLPAENAAIQHGEHPARWTYGNIEVMREQLKRLGLSYDWERELATCDPEYYRWNQWLFLLMYRRGLAYRAQARVNWCPSCQTVLANEQVVAGECWRCHSPVEQRELQQWFLRITAYAERLLRDLDRLPGWPERVKVMQRNWIGRSEGAEVRFRVRETGDELTVFTTRPDTLFGVTFMAISPRHPLALRLTDGTPRAERVRRMAEQMTGREQELAELEKEGVPTGAHAINPINGEAVPIWVANYVLMEYGTGAVMGVPAHDQRDLEFARRYGLPVRMVVAPPGSDGRRLPQPDVAYVEPGIMVQSGDFNGLPSEQGKEAVIQRLEATGKGRRSVQYRLRDWLISRQRYWGTPIPIVYCQRCGEQPVPEAELPVLLPAQVDFAPRGIPPLASDPDFLRARCPRCGGEARRETDTMDTFVDSSWYFLRFCSAHHQQAPFDREAVAYWMPVDQYIGGIEHAVLHLLYSRFFTKVLYDAGLVGFDEPFARLFTQGMVTLGGYAMSKSRGNVVDPLDVVGRYGADTARLFILFAAPPEKDLEWSESGVDGAYRFIQRVFRLVEQWGPALAGVPRYTPAPAAPSLGPAERELRRAVHRAVRKVTVDAEQRFAFNTAVAALMEAVNELFRYRDRVGDEARLPVVREALELLVLCLAPFVPHVAEEMWERLGHAPSVHQQPWPDYDPDALEMEQITVVVQVNGRVRDRLTLPADADEEQLRAAALASERVRRETQGRQVRRVVVVPGSLVNVVTDGRG